MIDKNLFEPLRKTLDMIVIGIDDSVENENFVSYIDENEEEFDVERSTN